MLLDIFFFCTPPQAARCVLRGESQPLPRPAPCALQRSRLQCDASDDRRVANLRFARRSSMRSPGRRPHYRCGSLFGGRPRGLRRPLPRSPHTIRRLLPPVLDASERRGGESAARRRLGWPRVWQSWRPCARQSATWGGRLDSKKLELQKKEERVRGHALQNGAGASRVREGAGVDRREGPRSCSSSPPR